MNKVIPFLLVLFFSAANAQKTTPSGLQSGPMLGYSEMREVMLWVQTSGAATVQFAYWEREKADAQKYWTDPVQTEKSTAFTAHCVADQVMPGKDYEAELFIDKKSVKLPYPVHFQSQSLWQWRSDPPSFKMALGSCAFVNEPELDRPGKPYGSDPEIFKTIAAQNPDLMVWLGDNTYLRESDWNTRTGIMHRYTHTRSLPEMQELLAKAHHYAIWDDHDFGPNDSDHSFVHKDLTLEAFKAFWANPSYGLDGQPGTTTQFQWADCDFFMLDNRYHRSGWAQTQDGRSMLGREQVRWLIDALKASYAPFKFVCIGGMVLSTAAVYENYINVFPQERQYILDAIQREGIPGVVFLTGDRHHTELSKWKPEGGVAVYDLTVSPLTSGAYPGDGDKNQHLVEGTEVSEPNFAMLEVTGARKDRVLVVKVLDAQGKEVWQRKIGSND